MAVYHPIVSHMVNSHEKDHLLQELRCLCHDLLFQNLDIVLANPQGPVGNITYTSDGRIMTNGNRDDSIDFIKTNDNPYILGYLANVASSRFNDKLSVGCW